MNPTIDVTFLRLEQPIDWSIYSTKPTACLLAVDGAISDLLLASVVTGAASVGCRFFVIWGEAADEMHDRVDEILENGSDDWLGILTTAHAEDSAEDVAEFLVTATLPGKKEARYLVIGDKSIEELRQGHNLQ